LEWNNNGAGGGLSENWRVHLHLFLSSFLFILLLLSIVFQ
jgi:hypothetical protein